MTMSGPVLKFSRVTTTMNPENMPIPKIDRHTMIVSDVAAVARLSVARIKQLDAELLPVRGRHGARRYDPAIVEKFIAARSGK